MSPNKTSKKIDWLITVVPLLTIAVLCTIFITLPKASNDILSKIRYFFGDTLGVLFDYWIRYFLSFLIYCFF